MLPEDAQWEDYVSERVKYFKRYATDKLIIAKIKTGSNSVITCNRVTVLALCTISDGRFSMYQFHLILFYTFRDMHRTNLILQKLGREITP